MPTGRIKFLDTERDFDFIRGDDDVEVFLHTSALPEGATAPKPRTRIEYGVIDGRKGPQALIVEILSPTRSVSAARRCKPQAMVPAVEGLIKLLDAPSTALRSGEYPENSRTTTKVPRAMADDFDA